MINPKLGKSVWVIRDELQRDGAREYQYVGISEHRIIAWDHETICSDSGGQGNQWSGLYCLPWSSYFETEHAATTKALAVAKEHEANGREVKIAPEVKSGT